MRVALGLVVVLGCASDPAGPIEVTIGGSPTLFAIKLDDGDSKKLTAYASGPLATTYLVERAHFYDLLFACSDTSRTWTRELRSTADELERLLVDWSPGCPPSHRTLSGRLHTDLQVNRVNAGAAQWENDRDKGDLDYSLPVAPALADVVISNPLAVAILRDQDLTRDLVAPTIDLTTAPAFVRGTIDFDPIAPDEHGVSFTELQTAHGTVVDWQQNAGDISLVPDSMLVEGDSQWGELYAFTATSGRGFFARFGENFPARVTLLPRLTEITLDPTSKSFGWSPFVDYSYLYGGCSTDSSWNAVTASRGWVEAHSGTLSLEPGLALDPTWIAPADPGRCYFGVSHTSLEQESWTSITL
ncbi:MAG: hypothetical protein ABI678_02235 [Kofleriaceae bacterium]